MVGRSVNLGRGEAGRPASKARKKVVRVSRAQVSYAQKTLTTFFTRFFKKCSFLVVFKSAHGRLVHVKRKKHPHTHTFLRGFLVVFAAVCNKKHGFLVVFAVPKTALPQSGGGP